MQHHYGPQVRFLDNHFLNGVLAKLCSAETHQPEINRLVELLYTQLIAEAVDKEFESETVRRPTRMTEFHPDVLLETRIAKQSQKAVVVNLARAGTWPSHICYDFLHHALPGSQLRQDHIMAARITDAEAAVLGTNFGSLKIGGDVKGADVLFPDPMGATGNTIVTAIDYYKNKVEGPARRFIALHLIVTPEYLKRVLAAHPDVVIYALRLDRGLSPRHVLEAPPGLHWDLEKGLNEKDYIVPGGGGFGEIMNNSFV
ncbi:MAG: uracil phosphoribosyltransferase [Bdellovibrionaceae bacterium]|nr:uracil phosphoribosyltransferase [Pseudobdellovibrionaceae bacterium]